KAAADRVLRRSPRAPIRHAATLVRRIPSGMTRPAFDDPGPVATVTDPRQAELHPGHFPVNLWEDLNGPTLYQTVTERLIKMLGANTVAERQAELAARLSPGALITNFERMSGPEGDIVVRMARQRFKDQGADVRIRARLSDLTVVAGPFDAEK